MNLPWILTTQLNSPTLPSQLFMVVPIQLGAVVQSMKNAWNNDEGMDKEIVSYLAYYC